VIAYEGKNGSEKDSSHRKKALGKGPMKRGRNCLQQKFNTHVLKRGGLWGSREVSRKNSFGGDGPGGPEKHRSEKKSPSVLMNTMGGLQSWALLCQE